MHNAVLPNFRRDRFLTAEVCAQKQKVLRSDYYDAFLRPLNALYIAGGIVANNDTVASFFSVQRSQRLGQFTESELQLLKLLMPHLQRAVHLHQHVREMMASVQAMDSLAVGMLLVSCSGKVLLANSRANAILNQRDGVTVFRGQLHVSHPAERCRLQHLISKTIQTIKGEGLHAGDVVPISRPSGKSPYQISVSPVRSEAFSIGTDGIAILLLTDPEMTIAPSLQALKLLCGLTTAETRIAVHLASGKSLEEVCEELSIRYTTAREIDFVFLELTVGITT